MLAHAKKRKNHSRKKAPAKRAPGKSKGRLRLEAAPTPVQPPAAKEEDPTLDREPNQEDLAGEDADASGRDRAGCSYQKRGQEGARANDQSQSPPRCKDCAGLRRNWAAIAGFDQRRQHRLDESRREIRSGERRKTLYLWFLVDQTVHQTRPGQSVKDNSIAGPFGGQDFQDAADGHAPARGAWTP